MPELIELIKATNHTYESWNTTVILSYPAETQDGLDIHLVLEYLSLHHEGCQRTCKPKIKCRVSTIQLD